MINQCRGYWVLSDALANAISLSYRLESERRELEARVRNAPCDDFDAKLLLLSVRMRGQVVKVLNPFLSFMNRYIPSKAHNMLSLMFDSHHKELSLVGSYVGRVSATHIAAEYNSKLLLPLFGSLCRKKTCYCCGGSRHI